MSSTDIYQDHELPPGSKCIRILNILPTSGSTVDADADPLKCTFDDVDLGHHPSFTALSYVWGKDPPTSQFFITCEDVLVPVTSNCLSALQHLRQKLGRVRIWVDAVCINQVDLNEKAHQIPLMGDIYSSAESVYVWLGNGTPETDRAMQYLADNPFQEYYREWRPTAAAWFICSAPWSRSKCPIPFPSNRSPRNKAATFTTFADLDELFSRPWIGRVWTYQEILLATNPVVVCGHSHVSWYSLECSLQFFAELVLEQISASWRSIALGREQLRSPKPSSQTAACLDHKKYASFLEKVKKARDLILVGLGGSFAVGIVCCSIGIGACFINGVIAPGIVLACLLMASGAIFFVPMLFDGSGALTGVFKRETAPTTNDLVSALYSRQATDPKDMAFGMWAVLEKLNSQHIEAPDYTSDTGDIYRTFTIRVLRATNSFDTFLYAAARSFPGQPSWVPDWTAHNQHGWGSNIGDMPKTDDYGWDKDPLTSDVPTPRPIIDKTRMIFTVQAYQVATISTCASFRETSNHFEAAERDIHLENFRWLQMQKAIDLLTGGSTQQHRPSGRSWNSFVRWSRNKSPAQMLALLESSESIGNPGKDVTEAYLRETREMDRWKVASFIAQYPSISAIPECSGICSSEAKIGDLIIRIRGLPQLLLVRCFSESTNAVRIVSPVVLNMFSLKRQWTLIQQGEPQRRYENYHIH